jgi:hypothetical protein
MDWQKQITSVVFWMTVCFNFSLETEQYSTIEAMICHILNQKMFKSCFRSDIRQVNLWFLRRDFYPVFVQGHFIWVAAAHLRMDMPSIAKPEYLTMFWFFRKPNAQITSD